VGPGQVLSLDAQAPTRSTPARKNTAALDDVTNVKGKPAAGSGAPRLPDLRFLELDVLPNDRVVFFEHEFVRGRARVFLGHIEEACACRREQLDLLSNGLSHDL